MPNTKIKPKKVTRKFLMDVARSIYNPSTRKYLRLCNGKLQNGPDPKDSHRPMHCGLGELYFAMTGKQPYPMKVDEDDVVNLAVEMSPLNNAVDSARDKAIKAVKALDVPDNVKDSLLSSLADVDDEEWSDAETEFRQILDDIPSVNDDGCEDGSCSTTDYLKRAKRVAECLRNAAKLLPT